MAAVTLDLFEPGMTEFHRLGLGSLAASCVHMKAQGQLAKEEFTYNDRKLTLTSDNLKNLLSRIYAYSFQVDEQWSMLRFPGAWNWSLDGDDGTRMAVLQVLQDSLMQSLLIPNCGPRSCTAVRNLKKEKKPEEGFFEFIINKSQFRTKRTFVLRLVSHTAALTNDLFSKKDNNALKDEVVVNSKIMPGFEVRHNAVPGTKIVQSATQAIALHFFAAGVQALPYCIPIHHTKRQDYRHIILFPEVNSLRWYVKHRPAMNPKSYVDCIVGGGVDAVVRAQLRLYQTYKEEGLSVFHMMAFQKVPWERQKAVVRTKVERFDFTHLKDGLLDALECAEGCFNSRENKGKDRSFFGNSMVLPLALDNIIHGRPWHRGLSDLVNHLAAFRKVLYEQKGLHAMTKNMEISIEHKLVEVIHRAMSSHYGMISKNHQNRAVTNQNVLFKKMGRARETWFFSFTRARDLASIRQAIMFMISRPFTNSVLRDAWPEVLTYLTQSEDWGAVRDTALLAISSYQSDKGQDIPQDDNEIDE